MKSFAWKSLMCVVAGVALAGCAELDVRGRGTIGAPPGTGVGQTAGEATHTLTTAELPQHSHTAQGSNDNASGAIPTGNSLGNGVAGLYGGATNLTSLHPATVGAQGGNQPHENMMPYLVINFCMALQGIFPSRN